jgi:hypothetical protein
MCADTVDENTTLATIHDVYARVLPVYQGLPPGVRTVTYDKEAFRTGFHLPLHVIASNILRHNPARRDTLRSLDAFYEYLTADVESWVLEDSGASVVGVCRGHQINRKTEARNSSRISENHKSIGCAPNLLVRGRWNHSDSSDGHILNQNRCL